MKQLDFIDDWKTLGFTPRKPKAEIPTPNLQYPREWLASLGTRRNSLLVVPGETPHIRGSIYAAIDQETEFERHAPREWLTKPIIEDWLDRLSRLRVGEEYAERIPVGLHSTSWEWLWALAYSEDFVLEEPLLSMAEEPRFLASTVTRILMYLRFFAMEDDPVQFSESLLAFLRWASRIELTEEDKVRLQMGAPRHRIRTLASPAEQIDIFMFLLSVAAQNGLFDRIVFVYDDLGEACLNSALYRAKLRELRQLTEAAARWSAYVNTPIGFILGFDPKKMRSLKRMHPQLAEEVSASLAWASV